MKRAILMTPTFPKALLYPLIISAALISSARPKL